MNGYKSGSALLVNAEVDSMGGVVDGGVGIGLKISPRRAAIEKAQAELREEYDAREERRRELEFLEKGGNPLDFKSGITASVSVQSTSITGQPHEQFVTSEAKGSFALTASPHTDSVDSSARPGAPLASEPNTADNLQLFNGENELPETERRCFNRRNNIAASEQSSQIGGSQNAKETEDSAIFRPYARRNRSRPIHGPRGASREAKGILLETNNQKNLNLPTVSKPEPSSLNGDIGTKNLMTDNTLNNELVGIRDHQSTSGSASVPNDKLDITVNINLKENPETVPSEDNTVENPILMATEEANVVELSEPVGVVNRESPSHIPTTKAENGPCDCQPNGFGSGEVDRKSVKNEGQNNIARLGKKNFDLGSSCTRTSFGRHVNNDNDMCTNTKTVDTNENTMEQTFTLESKLNSANCEVVKDRHKTKIGAIVSNEHDAGCQDHSGSDNIVKAEEDFNINSSSMSNIKGVHNDSTTPKADNDTVLVDQSNVKESSSERHQVPVDVSLSESPQTALAEKVKSATLDDQPCAMHSMKLVEKAREDSILEEAQIIEAKRKRIVELSLRSLPTQNQRKSHWGFVLEEMAWLANDFAQERLWKIAAAGQLGHQAAFTCMSRSVKLDKQLETKVLSHKIAKAVMQFWHSAELLLDNDLDINCILGCVKSGNVDANEAMRDQRRNYNVLLETSKLVEGQNPVKHAQLKVHAYALRFLKANRSHGISSQAEAPTTPEKIFDSSTVDMSWDEHLNEENLFYEVSPTATETYRKAIESHFHHFENKLFQKIGNSIQEEIETSVYDTTAEFGSQENAYDEEEGENSTYYLPGVYEGNKSSKSAQKKHKNLKSYTPRCGDAGADLPYVHYTTGTQSSMMFGKRPASLNVGSIPTKRMRTATRHRVVSPFTNLGTVQAQAKADASSGDTNSFHDDQSTLHVGPLIQKGTEVESNADFEKQLSYDCAETFVKTKKKKAKTLGSMYDQGWQLDCVVLNEQRDQSKKRGDSHHFESIGSGGLYGQHKGKKPKLMRPLDNPLDNIVPLTNSIPSPAASQMSNMSSPNKFIKIISGRDRGRKTKSLKTSAGQPGSGSPWSLFEDQALVVLVHDMGPNWELVSDAINSALQIKCVFRKPKECKDRHKILMDRTTGDGADSAEDSGSSQSYPSTLPGIPKQGSARQLFQRLQGPMEEDTLKSHFEKIIKIGQKQHYFKNQVDNQDSKQVVPAHNSHVIALSLTSPNNLNGNLLTPLDLCEAEETNPDVPAVGYQGSHPGGLTLPHQGSIQSTLTTSGVNSSLPGSSGMVLGHHLSSSSGSAITSVRYGIPRNSPSSVDEQQRIQYNQMLSGRSIQQTIPVTGTLSGSDHGRMLPGGNGIGIMGGINKAMAMSRPGFQGLASPSMLNSGSMISSSMVGMPSPVNMHSGVGPGPGNSILRPHETLHMMRPGHNPEHQRQMMVPELQMQVTQGNSQGIPALCGLSSSFSNQTTPPVQPYPGHAQQSHQLSQQQSHLSNPRPHLQGPSHTNSQQQTYAVRLAKERQRYLQHQQQLAASNALLPHVQAKSQLPISSTPLQNSSQVQPQNSSQQVPHSPITPSSPLTPMSSQLQQQKLHQSQPVFSRNPPASGLTNQAAKQRPRHPPQQPSPPQQYQQSGRQHPNQRNNVQSQQQAKLMKGMGRGNMLVHPNLSVDTSHLSGLSLPVGSQTGEKGDPILHMMQGQNIYPGSGLNPKPLGHAHSSNHQQKLHSVSPTTSSKQLHIPSDTKAQAQVSPVSSGQLLSPTQPAVIASNHHQLQPQSQSKKINHTQTNVQRMLPLNHPVHTEPLKSDPIQADQQSANSASQVSTCATMTQSCMDSVSAVPVIATVSSQRKTAEPPFDSTMKNQTTQISSLGSAPAGNSTGNEQPTISQGLEPRSVSLTCHAHNSDTQWQKHQVQPLQQAQPILSQQPYQTEQQKQHEKEEYSPKDLVLQPQQHLPHLQSGQNSMFIQPPNSKVE
ncbi:chromatin modification-related protein EAF1 B-like isoform X3 [Vigna unguiculata]|uniref:chromatin modification-related protein EAF1 B-like isoform X3 n=1 Tax=Vigna unguiculata TaxID=3917 RepID=UPI0010161982|nr:chromatin modification-related protein EAF1 B-like isoform X3 [Vigna unguiculata]